MTVHSHRSIDTDTGLKDTMSGLCMEPLSITPEFNRVDYMDGLNDRAVMILNNKKLVLDCKAKVLKRAGVMSHKHPGTAIHRSYVTEFHSGVDFGFDSNTASSGYFIYLPQSGQKNRGEYDDTNFKLELWQQAAQSIDVVGTPSYP